jgi:hypothetical protein
MGLLRVLLALILWSAYGEWMALFYSVEPTDVLLRLAFWLGSVALLVGIASRAAAAWCGILQMWLVLGIGGPRFDHHHTWLLAMATFLLAFTPCGGSFSVDRWLRVRRAAARGAPVPEERGPLWASRLICFQVTALYLLAAWDKLTPGFLSGQRLEMIAATTPWFGSDFPQPYWSTAMCGLAVTTVAIELFLAIALWFRLTRDVAMALGIALHFAFYLLIPVGTFSVTTVALYLAFVDPDRFHRAIDALLGRPADVVR